MLDESQIRLGLLRVVQELIGSSLSSVGQAGNEEPAVIFAGEGGNRPDFPYATVDLLSLNPVSWDEVNRFTYEDGAEIKTEYHKDYVVDYLINIYGSKNSNTSTIANNLEQLMGTQRGLDSISTNTGGELLSKSSTQFSRVYLDTLYQEVAGINVSLSVRSIATEIENAVELMGVESNFVNDLTI